MILPFGIPTTMMEEHFEKENELALPIIGITRELGEGKSSEDYSEALELFERFRPEYENMLKEHVEIVNALEKLEAAATKAKNRTVLKFAHKLKLHAKTEEDLTYPAVLMAGRLLKQPQ